jgi:hypothetical protein
MAKKKRTVGMCIGDVGIEIHDQLFHQFYDTYEDPLCTQFSYPISALVTDQLRDPLESRLWPSVRAVHNAHR